MINVKKFIKRIKKPVYAIVVYDKKNIGVIIENGIFKQVALKEVDESPTYELRTFDELELPEYIDDIKIVSKETLTNNIVEHISQPWEI